VAVNGRVRDEEVDATVSALDDLAERALFVQGDCGLAADAKRVVEETCHAFGGLDVLVHAAGGPVPGRLFEIEEEDWMRAFQVHVHAVFHLCRAAIPHMKARGGGSIVLISSTAGIRGVANNIAYQSAKGALPQITRALAREFADHNIRVNCVAPGVVRTRFHDDMTEEAKQLNLQHRIPLHREGTPDQVATLIREVASNDYITGETMVIDGGLTMRIA